jgi:hypothetical protein
MATEAKTMSVHRYCVRKLGVHRGAIAAARVAQWAIATAELGHLPTTVEYSEWWAVTERTGWYHRAAVHAALGDEWPQVVEQLARLAQERKARSPRAVQQLAVVL